MKKAILFFMIFAIIFSLSGCGCEHEWEKATCNKPKTCSLCGKTKGETRKHRWKKATCDKPKTCSLCGETKGKALGHKWTGPTCVYDEFCSVCGAEKSKGAKALGHDFKDGYCTRCSIDDPDYIDAENFGFVNNNGMNEWIDVAYYDSTCVAIPKWNQSFYYGYRFTNKYVDVCHSKNYFDESGNRADDKSAKWDAEKYEMIDNEAFETHYREGRIYEREKINDKVVIIKGKMHKYGNSFDFVCVPADMLDFSTARYDESEEVYFVNYKQ